MKVKIKKFGLRAAYFTLHTLPTRARSDIHIGWRPGQRWSWNSRVSVTVEAVSQACRGFQQRSSALQWCSLLVTIWCFTLCLTYKEGACWDSPTVSSTAHVYTHTHSAEISGWTRSASDVPWYVIIHLRQIVLWRAPAFFPLLWRRQPPRCNPSRKNSSIPSDCLDFAGMTALGVKIVGLCSFTSTWSLRGFQLWSPGYHQNPQEMENKGNQLWA